MRKINKLHISEFFLALSLLKSKMFSARIPLIANLLLTNRCNLKCFYCYANIFNRVIKEHDTNVWLGLIDELRDAGTKIIILLGGEPLLRNDIGKIISYVKSKGMICELLTNGTYVKKRINEIKDVDSVCLSLDGNREEHDLNRGTGAFEQCIEAIETLRKYNIPVRIKACVTKNNKNCLDFLGSFAKEKNILFTASPAESYEERDYAQKDKWLSHDEIRDFIKELRKLKEDRVPIGYSFKALDYIINWPYNFHYVIDKDKSNNPFSYRLIRCLRKANSFYVDADGGLYPCAAMWGRGGINVFNDGFRAAWDKLEDFNCYACGSLPDVDITLFLNLHWENILKAAKLVMGGRLY